MAAWPVVNAYKANTRTIMAKDAVVSREMAEKFKTEKDTPYLRFVRAEGLDIISAQYVPNLRTVDLKPWPRRGDGAKGVYINHEASRTSNDCYVCEIAPGKKLEPAASSLRGNDHDSRPAAARPRCGTMPARASPSSGRRARSSPFRSIAGTSISTAPDRSPCVLSR